MSSHQAFLSYSFADTDESLIDVFRTILDDVGVVCHSGEFVPRMVYDVVELIKRYRLFIAVLSPRGGGEVPGGVSVEIGVAISQGRDIIIFREDSVRVQALYAGLQQLPFSRELLLARDLKELSRVKQAIIELCQRYGYHVGPEDREIARRYEFAREQCQILGSVILRYYNEVIRSNPNADPRVKNFPTEADKRANRIIIEAIDANPLTQQDGIVSEESTQTREIRDIIRNHEFTWIIDPIDGTMNFCHGFPYFCISMGLLRHGVPEVGVVYAPTTQELYCGRRGYVSEVFELGFGRRRILQQQRNPKSLSECMVMTHISSRHAPRAATIPLIEPIVNRCRGVRVLGSGQMALISLALGQFDIFFKIFQL